jgi:hypothetical protein
MPSQGYVMEHGIIIFGVQMTVWFSFRGTKLLMPIVCALVCVDAAFKIMYYMNKP